MALGTRPRGPTPDMVIHPPLQVNGAEVGWVDAKNFYASALFARKRFMPEAHMAETAARYNAAYGTGAFVLRRGFCERLLAQTPALLLDGGPVPLDADLE